MKNLRSGRNIFFVAFFFVTLLFQIYFASQVFSDFTLDAVESHEIFNLNVNRNLKIFSNNNTRNTVFQFSREILKVGAERGQNDSLKAVFDVLHSVAIPLRRDLTLSFSIFARQLNLNTDAGRLYLVLSNGTNKIILNYVVGYKETDWKHGTSLYIFYQIGSDTNTWFNGRRNLWNDLIGKELTLKSSWNIISINFGCISYWKEPSINNKMYVFFNASKTSLYYEKSTFTRVIPTVQVSWLAVYGMIASMLLFPISSVILLRIQK